MRQAKFFRFLRMASVAALCAGAVLRAGAEPADDQMQFADGLFARGLHDLALKEYMTLLRESPQYGKLDQVLFRIGECYRGQTNSVAADLFYRRTANEYPKSDYRFRAEFRRAEAMAVEEKWADALPLFQALISEKPPEEILAATRYHAGYCLTRLGRAGESVALYRAVADAAKPTDYTSLAALEWATYLRGEKKDDAEQARLYALALARPFSPALAAEARFQQAELAYRRGLFSEADAAYAQLLKEFPEHPRAAEARLAAAWAAYRNGRFADALAATNVADAMPPAQAAEWLYLRANAQRQLMDAPGAGASYRELLKKHPQHALAAVAAYERALMDFQARRYAEVVEQLKDFQPGETADPAVAADVRWLLAESYAGSGQTNLAVQCYRQLSDSGSVSRGGDALYRLARMLEDRGDTAGAAAAYIRVADRFPKHDAAPQSLYAAGACLAAAQHPAEAAAAWARLIKDYPASALTEDALYQKGLAELRLQRDDIARGTFGTLLQQFSKGRFVAEARLCQALLLEKAKEYRLAETELRTALKNEPPPKPDVERQIRFRLAGILQRLDQLDEAADLLQGLLATPVREDMSPTLLEWLARKRLDQNRGADALAAAQAWLARAGGDEAAMLRGQFVQGRAWLEMGKKTEATASFVRAASGSAGGRDGITALLELGGIESESGAWNEAFAHYQAAAERASAQENADLKARALRGLGAASEKRGEVDAAVRYYLSVAILYDDATLSPECLWRAAAGFAKLNQPVRRDQTLAELKQRYPRSEWAAKPLP